MSQDAESAIEVVEVTDVQSAADEIERRMTASEEPQILMLLRKKKPNRWKLRHQMKKKPN